MQDFLFLKIGNSYYKLKFSEILYVQAEKKQILIATVNKVYLSSVSIGQIEKFLPNHLFHRIHRSFIVSLAHVDHFENDAAYVGATRLPIAEQYRSNFRKALTIVNGELRTFRLDNDDVDKLLRDLNP